MRLGTSGCGPAFRCLSKRSFIKIGGAARQHFSNPCLLAVSGSGGSSQNVSYPGCSQQKKNEAFDELARSRVGEYRCQFPKSSALNIHTRLHLLLNVALNYLRDSKRSNMLRSRCRLGQESRYRPWLATLEVDRRHINQCVRPLDAHLLDGGPILRLHIGRL